MHFSPWGGSRHPRTASPWEIRSHAVGAALTCAIVGSACSNEVEFASGESPRQRQTSDAVPPSDQATPAQTEAEREADAAATAEPATESPAGGGATPSATASSPGGASLPGGQTPAAGEPASGPTRESPRMF